MANGALVSPATLKLLEVPFIARACTIEHVTALGENHLPVGFCKGRMSRSGGKSSRVTCPPWMVHHFPTARLSGSGNEMSRGFESHHQKTVLHDGNGLVARTKATMPCSRSILSMRLKRRPTCVGSGTAYGHEHAMPKSPGLGGEPMLGDPTDMIELQARGGKLNSRALI